jgi:hypothetical protein
VNLGGASVKSGSELDFHLDRNPNDFTIELLFTATILLSEVCRLHREWILPLERNAYVCKSFIQQIYALMLAENCTSVRLSTQGCQILSRFYIFGSVKQEGDQLSHELFLQEEAGQGDPDVVPRKTWTLAELEQFNHIIIEGQTTTTQSRPISGSPRGQCQPEWLEVKKLSAPGGGG